MFIIASMIAWHCWLEDVISGYIIELLELISGDFA